MYVVQNFVQCAGLGGTGYAADCVVCCYREKILCMWYKNLYNVLVWEVLDMQRIVWYVAAGREKKYDVQKFVCCIENTNVLPCKSFCLSCVWYKILYAVLVWEVVCACTYKSAYMCT